MQERECVVVKVAEPTKRKAEWLADMADRFRQAVQFALDVAQDLQTSSRGKIHEHSYYEIRERFDLPSDYTRMAINAAVSLARSYFGQRKSPHVKRTSFPTLNGSQGIGLGTQAYRLVQSGNRWVLRLSTGKRGHYIWLPLCVPKKFQDRFEEIEGDGKLFERDGNWYAMLPRRVTPTPPVRDGEPAFIGVDMGIAKTATVSTPDGIYFFDGEPARHKREHFADLRRRYQRANRLDKVKQMRGKETRWMRNRNHVISKRIVEIAAQYDNPVIVFENLTGLRNRAKGSKRFNRMLSSWAFRELLDFVEYKAARLNIPVIRADPRNTSKTCSRCGYASRHNRRKQGLFYCHRCGFEHNADANAAINIAARGASEWADEQGASDKPRSRDEDSSSRDQTAPVEGWPDVVKRAAEAALQACHETTTFTLPV